MIDPREEKLPQWARAKLHTLRRQIDTLEARIEDIEDSVPTQVVIDSYSKWPRYLPSTTTVRFIDDNDFWVDVRLRRGVVEVMAESAVEIAPQVTNVVLIREARR